MSDEARQDLDLGEDDSLPWLETADDYEQSDGPAAGKVIGLVVAALVLLALVVGGIYLFQNRQGETGGNGELIAAQEGDYKVAPEDPQGKQFEGEGDAAFAASEGKSRESNAVPGKAKSEAAASSGQAKAASSAQAGDADKAAATSGVSVQLAALGSEAAAEQQWNRLAAQFEYLKDMRHRIVAAQVEGRSVYRLSAISSSRAAADALCGRIKGDGGNCLITG